MTQDDSEAGIGSLPPAAEGSVAASAYWRATVRLTVGLMALWFAASYGAGILLRDWLDRFAIGGAPLGFWFAQQGAIYVFVLLIFYYCWAMRRLERKFRIER